MIVNTVNEFIKWLPLKTGTTVSFGDRDLGADELPHIQVIPVSSFNVKTLSPDDNSVEFPVTLKIIVSRTDETMALTILEKLLNSLPTFDTSQGHYIDASGTSEYTPNTYEVSIVFFLKSIIGE